MKQEQIIIKRGAKENGLFPMIVMLLMILLLVFQVVASRHILKANRNFIKGEETKRIVAESKAHKALIEKDLAEERLLKQQEEAALLESAGEQNLQRKSSRIAEVEKRMDYRQKLDVYRRSANAK